MCCFTPHIFIIFKPLITDILFATKKRERTQPTKVCSFSHTQHCRQWQNRIKSYSLWLLHIGNHLLYYDKKNSLFCKLFRIKISSKSFFQQFMPLFKPELKTCPVCESTHAVLPDFIIPYCSYSLFFILRVLGSYFFTSVLC